MKAEVAMRKTIIPVLAVVAFLILSAPGGAVNADKPSRNYVLFFEILDYTRAMGDAVSFFLGRVLEPGDQLIIYTPARVYSFSRTTLSRPRRDLILDVQDRLRGDTAYSSANYKTIMEDMRIQSRDLGDSTELNSIRRSLTLYRQSLANLRSLRKVNEALLEDIVEMFRSQTGENHVVMSYQAEFRPIPDRETLNRLRAMPVIAFEANELFQEADKALPLDADLFIDKFRESAVTLHFFYIKTKDAPPVRDLLEQSVDMYNAFSRIAAATGGIVETTASPEAGFKALLKALAEPGG
jgi:hypothetical protein